MTCSFFRNMATDSPAKFVRWTDLDREEFRKHLFACKRCQAYVLTPAAQPRGDVPPAIAESALTPHTAG